MPCQAVIPRDRVSSRSRRGHPDQVWRGHGWLRWADVSLTDNLRRAGVGVGHGIEAPSMVATIQIDREADDSLSGEPRTLRFARRRRGPAAGRAPPPAPTPAGGMTTLPAL